MSDSTLIDFIEATNSEITRLARYIDTQQRSIDTLTRTCEDMKVRLRYTEILGKGYSANEEFTSFVYGSNQFLVIGMDQDKVEDIVRRAFPDVQYIEYRFCETDGWAVLVCIFKESHKRYELSKLESVMELDDDEYDECATIFLDPGSTWQTRFITNHIKMVTEVPYEDFEWIYKLDGRFKNARGSEKPSRISI